ncbi:glycosyl transferase [Chytriomyces sp. MP71]|nr:glycosyl transferase [Chytriomyces sp. MP71]
MVIKPFFPRNRLIYLLLLAFSAFLLLPNATHLLHASTANYDASLAAHERAYLAAAASLQNASIPVLVMGCNRISITRALDAVLLHRDRADPRRFPVHVSLGCQNATVRRVVEERYGAEVVVWEMPRVEIEPRAGWGEKVMRYTPVALNYNQALSRIFANASVGQVILLEDDLEISPDFFSYFSATLPLLYMDPTLWCISSWNDQSRRHLLGPDAGRLLRTDFMPGLGWLLTRAVYESVQPWTFGPEWDQWMRRDAQRRGRQCVVPELPRNRNFGREGVSAGVFFDDYIAHIGFADDATAVDFGARWKEVAGLVAGRYQETMMRDVYEEAVLGLMEGQGVPVVKAGGVVAESVQLFRVEYNNATELKNMLDRTGMMSDSYHGVFRSSYRGIISYWHKATTKVYLAPKLHPIVFPK